MTIFGLKDKLEAALAKPTLDEQLAEIDLLRRSPEFTAFLGAAVAYTGWLQHNMAELIRRRV